MDLSFATTSTMSLPELGENVVRRLGEIINRLRRSGSWPVPAGNAEENNGAIINGLRVDVQAAFENLYGHLPSDSLPEGQSDVNWTAMQKLEWFQILLRASLKLNAVPLGFLQQVCYALNEFISSVERLENAIRHEQERPLINIANITNVHGHHNQVANTGGCQLQGHQWHGGFVELGLLSELTLGFRTQFECGSSCGSNWVFLSETENEPFRFIVEEVTLSRCWWPLECIMNFSTVLSTVESGVSFKFFIQILIDVGLF